MKLTHSSKADTISSALGINDQRETELQQVVEAAVKKITSEGEGSISDYLENLAESCNTPEELAWVAYEFGAQVSTAQGGGLESIFGAMLAGGFTPGEGDGGFGTED